MIAVRPCCMWPAESLEHLMNFSTNGVLRSLGLSMAGLLWAVASSSCKSDAQAPEIGAAPPASALPGAAPPESPAPPHRRGAI